MTVHNSGRIEGVYNVGQRSKIDEDIRNIKKNNPSSATSSDYDKTGGQSSSNVDSGRGSAAYSSGRRPGGIDLNGESCDSGHPTGNFRDSSRKRITTYVFLYKKSF